MPEDNGLEILTLESLEDLDAVTVAEWQKAIEGAVRDCQDRPMEEKPREIALIVKIKPVSDTNGKDVVCVSAELELTVKTTRPAHTRGGKNVLVYADGRCAFNPLATHNARQGTLPLEQ